MLAKLRLPGPSASREAPAPDSPAPGNPAPGNPASDQSAAEPGGYQVVPADRAGDAGWIVSFSGRRGDTHRIRTSAWGPFEFVKTLTGKNLHRFYVRDSRNRWYQDGVEGLATGIDAAAAAIRNRLEATPFERIMTVGNSMGGYAAILYGILIGADKVVAFAPQSFIGRQMRAEHGDRRWHKDLGRILEADMPYPDLLPLIAGTPGVKIAIYYCDGDPLDRLHAERLRHLPNVSIHALESSDHNVARTLRQWGMLSNIIDCEMHDLPIPPMPAASPSPRAASPDKVAYSSTVNERVR